MKEKERIGMNQLNSVLEELFNRWKVEQSKDKKTTCNSKNGYVVATNSFYKDGIVNLKEYQNSEKKVLFITNEVSIDCKQDNDEKKHGLKGKCEGGHLVGNDEGNTVCSFAKYINGEEQETWSGKMRIKFGEMYRIITEGENYEMGGITEKSEKALEKNKEALKKIAFMNLNKRGGFGNIQGENFLKYIETYKDYIRREIEIINPDVIVWCACNTYKKKYMDAIFDDKYKNVWQQKELVLNKKEIPILRMWHPSVRAKSMEKYLNKFSEVWEEYEKAKDDNK